MPIVLAGETSKVGNPRHPRVVVTGLMPSSRPRIPLLLCLLLFAVICFVVPRFRYAVDVAVLELRYSALFLILLAAFVWVLIKLGPRNRK